MAELKEEKMERETMTPEEMAAAIIKDAVQTQLVEIEGTYSQKLDVLARYNKRDAIQVHGEKYWNTRRDAFRKDALQELIEAKHKAIVDYMQKKQQAAKDELYRMLRSKGMSPVEADKVAYGA